MCIAVFFLHPLKGILMALLSSILVTLQSLGGSMHLEQVRLIGSGVTNGLFIQQTGPTMASVFSNIMSIHRSIAYQDPILVA